jgi:diamine N-acetyltransferase
MTGKNLKLRAIEPSDIDLLYRWENDPSIWHISNTVAPFSRFVLEQYVLNSHEDIFTAKQLRLMIELTKNQLTVGAVDLFDFEPLHRRVGLGILIANENRGQGFASEAVDLILNYCFETLMVHQVYCNISDKNNVSKALFKSKGFQVSVTKKDWLLINNQWVDELLLQKINPLNQC